VQCEDSVSWHPETNGIEALARHEMEKRKKSGSREGEDVTGIENNSIEAERKAKASIFWQVQRQEESSQR